MADDCRSLIAAVSGVVVLGPSVLAIAGVNAASTWPNIFISTAVIVVLLVIAVAGIRLTARTQVAMGLIEYAILIGFSVWGFVAVLGHHHGNFPDHQGLVQPQRNRRARRPGGRPCSSRCS